MAKQNDPSAGKWAFAPGGKDKAARALASEDRKPYGRRTPKEIESLNKRSDARKGAELMTASTVVTGADAFLDAASIIRARGWIQHRYEDLDTGAVCVERALYLACYPSLGAADLVDDLPADVRATVYDVVTGGGGFLNADGEIPDPAVVIWEFNDREASEVDDVLALLARCAAKAQAAATAAVHRGGLNSDINGLTASDRKAG